MVYASPIMLRRPILLGLIAAVATLTACGASDSSSGARSDGRLSVYTVNYPLLYFAERIGGDHVAVSLPAPAEADPALWSPSAEVVGLYQQADLILLHGAGYADWVERAALPRSRLVDTGASLAARWIPLKDAITHSHGSEGEHSHAGSALETWLDPQLAIEHARAIATALASARPEAAADFERGLAELVADLDQLDRELEEATATLADRFLVFSHPIYEYLIARFGLQAESVHWETTKVPGHFRLVELDEKIGDRQADWMVWEADPLPEAVTLLAERGMRSIVVRPCANRPEEGDFMSLMQLNVAALASIG